jgi:hypothetical protein
MRFKVRSTPFFWILAASAAGHLALFFLTHGALLLPSRQQPPNSLPAGFAPLAPGPTVESSKSEEVFYRVPVPGAIPDGRPVRTGASPAVPQSLTTTSPKGTAPSNSSPIPDTPTPASWTRALESGRGSGPLFFGQPYSGKSVVFVIDVSGSMLEKSGKTTRLHEAFDGVMRALGGLEPSQRFNVLLYADRVDAFQPQPVAGERSAILAAFRYLESDVNCGGSTNLQEALRNALAMDPDSILLLSDGEANSEDSAILAEMRYLHARQKRKTRIDTVGFYLETGSKPERLLKQLSAESGGGYASWNPHKSTARIP